MFESLLFKLLIERIKEEGLHARMALRNGQVPLTARDGQEFQKTHGAAFLHRCRSDWTNKPQQQQRDELRRFMKEKFSVDVQGEVMVPKPVQRWVPAAIDWGHSFYMSELEMECIANAVMLAYYRVLLAIYKT